ncbi:MAG: phenylalanine--tRNA ligase subunit beta, partial [Nitrospiria bacterium]
RAMSLDQLETLLPLVKGELKEYVQATDELRIELNDTNRPDLWCVEGIARQMRGGQRPAHPARQPSARSTLRIRVASDLKDIRPYIGACVARGMAVTQTLLTQFIQTQEKLADLFGRRRQTVSIGLYPLGKIEFPVSYTTAAPDEARFVPLGAETPMTLREILAGHPKGKAYGSILSGAARYPLLVDRRGEILSFPPIINSQALGAVAVGDDEVLVEVTGTDQRMVHLAVNIWAANLTDRGARVEPVAIEYEWTTPAGRRVITPRDLSRPVSVPSSLIERVLGERMTPTESTRWLVSYGHRVTRSGSTLRVTPPPYRDDVLHPIDVVEDVAIARGYAAFDPVMPTQFTVGSLTPLERYADRVRELLVGFGFQETMANILTSREDVIGRMGHPEDLPGLVEVDNPMSESFAVLRPTLLASLLRVEGASSKASYPHKIFELGETAVVDDGTCRTELRAGALLAHASAAFSDAHAILESLAYAMGFSYRLEPVAHPSFIEGRAGSIIIDERPRGTIGEVSPAVLERWGIGMPCAVFDLALDGLV